MMTLLLEHYRWHLAVLGEKESNLYLVNGLLLTFLFFFCARDLLRSWAVALVGSQV